MVTLDNFIGKKETIKDNIEKPKEQINIKEIPENSEKNNSTPWTIKYSPINLEGLIGQKKQVEKIRKFIDNFKNEKKKALMLFGPSGVGKSLIAKLLADENDLELVELNASDQRNKAIIEEQLGNVLRQQSLFGKGKIVLLDDLDGISGSKDRGGAQAVAKLIIESRFPIIITCQDPYVDKLKSIRSKTNVLGFDSLGEEEISGHLKEILKKEKIKYTDEDVKIISLNAQGDLRAAINDIQMISMGKDYLDVAFIKEMGKRLQNNNMKDAITNILKSQTAEESINSFDGVQGDVFQEGLMWLDYNMPKEYVKPLDRARAYGFLTKAEVFKSRILRRQNWRLLVYVNSMMTAGVSISKDQAYLGQREYTTSSRILKMWQANMKYGRRKAIAEKVAEHTHCSLKQAIINFEFYAKILLHDENNQLELDKEDLNYLKNLVG